MIDFEKIYNNNSIKIGDNIEIAFYAIAIIIGMLVGLYILSRLFKTRGIEPEFSLTIFLYAIPLGILFARLGYVLPRLGEYKNIIDILNVKQGGLTITTGFIGGLIGVLIGCKVHKKSFFRIADLVVVPLLIAQAIGRWGNFFNGELYGSIVTESALQHFPLAIKIPNVDNNWHYALFFYEGMLNVFAAGVIFLYIHFYFPKINEDKIKKLYIMNENEDINNLYKDKIPPGMITFIYVAWYSIVRALLEILKDESNNVHRIPNTNIKAIQLILAIIAPLAFIVAMLIYFKLIKLESNKTKKLHFNFKREELLYRYYDNQEILKIKDVEVLDSNEI